LVREGGYLIGEVERAAASVEGCFCFFNSFDLGIDAGVIHPIYDDADDQVQHDHGAEQDKRDEVDNGERRLCFGLEIRVKSREVSLADIVALIDMRAVDLEIHHVSPVLESDDAKETEQRVGDMAKVDRVVFGKEHNASNSINIEEEE